MKSETKIFGHGTGRMVNVKDLLSEVNENVKILIIDPEKEYENISRRSFRDNVNPLEIRSERE
jgi:hypothetical protein